MAAVELLRDMALAELMTQFPETIPVFLRHRMACVGCDINAFVTVAEAIAQYKLDEREFLAELGAVIQRADLPPHPIPNALPEEKP